MSDSNEPFTTASTFGASTNTFGGNVLSSPSFGVSTSNAGALASTSTGGFGGFGATSNNNSLFRFGSATPATQSSGGLFGNSSAFGTPCTDFVRFNAATRGRELFGQSANTDISDGMLEYSNLCLELDKTSADLAEANSKYENLYRMLEVFKKQNYKLILQCQTLRNTNTQLIKTQAVADDQYNELKLELGKAYEIADSYKAEILELDEYIATLEEKLSLAPKQSGTNTFGAKPAIGNVLGSPSFAVSTPSAPISGDPFGSSTPVTGTGLFGHQNTGFGAPASTSTGGFGEFGATSDTNNLFRFGSATPATQSSGGLFDNSSAFGTPCTDFGGFNAATRGRGLFGQSANTSTGLFGSSGTNTFGGEPATGNVLGSPSFAVSTPSAFAPVSTSTGGFGGFDETSNSNSHGDCEAKRGLERAKGTG